MENHHETTYLRINMKYKYNYFLRDKIGFKFELNALNVTFRSVTPSLIFFKIDLKISCFHHSLI